MTSVNEYVKTIDDVEPTLRRFQEMISKYTFMQQNVEKRAAGLKEKLPEMKSALETVRFLKRKRDKLLQEGGVKEEHDLDDNDNDNDEEAKEKAEIIETTFSLSDTLYAMAKIRPREVEEVYLWLGANVMVGYPLAEAEELLQGKLEKAKESLGAAQEDLEFLRVQITTLEVATARVFNWDVGEKRRLRAEGKLVDGEGSGKEEKEEDG